MSANVEDLNEICKLVWKIKKKIRHEIWNTEFWIGVSAILKEEFYFSIPFSKKCYLKCETQ